MSRYSIIRHERGEWLVLDNKGPWPKTICVCSGGQAPFNAEHIREALEAHHQGLYDRVLGDTQLKL
jgi:hypothetical protein